MLNALLQTKVMCHNLLATKTINVGFEPTRIIIVLCPLRNFSFAEKFTKLYIKLNKMPIMKQINYSSQIFWGILATISGFGMSSLDEEQLWLGLFTILWSFITFITFIVISMRNMNR